LNLLLRIAERGHKLPLLKQNIKCGNSLIDDETVSGKKAFSWEKEFESIMIREGGFDVIIGNPPYVHQKGEKDNPMISFKERAYFRENYESLSNKNGKTRGGVKLNLFIPYVERCVKLLKQNGKMGFIVHKNLLKVESYKFLRQFLLNNCAIEQIVDLGAGVFKEVTGETIIIVLRKKQMLKRGPAIMYQ
jgi:type I restriction-modification system DNA methylase subunit